MQYILSKTLLASVLLGGAIMSFVPEWRSEAAHRIVGWLVGVNSHDPVSVFNRLREFNEEPWEIHDVRPLCTDDGLPTFMGQPKWFAEFDDVRLVSQQEDLAVLDVRTRGMTVKTALLVKQDGGLEIRRLQAAMNGGKNWLIAVRRLNGKRLRRRHRT